MDPMGTPPATVTDVVQRLRAIEREWTALHAKLERAVTGKVLPGLFLVVRANDVEALVPAGLVREIAPMVRLSEAGMFVYRGEPCQAIPVAELLGRPASGAAAALVILARTPACALVVDQASTLIEDPACLRADPGEPPCCELGGRPVQVITAEWLDRAGTRR